jgi:thioesterase domain-containing protein/acyl carrier protein
METQIHDELRREIRISLPAVLHPARLHMLPRLPRLPSAKLDVLALQDYDRAVLEREDALFSASMTTTGRIPTRGGSTGELANVVERAWRKSLRQRLSLPDRSWDEAGGDSLKLLRFVFELETELGRNLPLEIFRLDMRPGDFVEAIERALLSHSREATDDPRPIVFLLPGLTGDCPGLAAFRAELDARIRFVPIEYPDWPEIANSRCTVDEMADAALTEIMAVAPAGDVSLAGYSFGGAVAFAIAERLVKTGRGIAFFGILDSNISGLCDASNTLGRRMQKALLGLCLGTDSLEQRACQIIAQLLTHPRNARLLRHLAKRRHPMIPNGTRFALHMEVCEALQMRAFADWMQNAGKPRLPTRALLLRSLEPRPDAPDDLGWTDLFDELEIVRISGDHHEMLRVPHRAGLCARFEEALQASQQAQDAYPYLLSAE